MDIIPQDIPCLKKCSKCPNSYPATTQYFGRDKYTKDGLYPSCKTCKSAQGKAWRDTNPDYLKHYYQEHKEEHNRYSRNYQIIHKEEIQAQRKVDYWSHVEEKRAQNKACCAINGEKYREHQRQYSKTEHGRAVKRACEQNRIAKKKAIEGTLTSAEIQQKLKAQHYHCYYAMCGYAKFEKVNGKYIYHIEHTVPVSRTEAQPRHDINHVVLSCPSCNMRKHNKLPHEFFEGGRLL